MTYQPRQRSFFGAVLLAVAVYFVVEFAATAAAVWVLRWMGVL